MNQRFMEITDDMNDDAVEAFCVHVLNAFDKHGQGRDADNVGGKGALVGGNASGRGQSHGGGEVLSRGANASVKLSLLPAGKIIGTGHGSSKVHPSKHDHRTNYNSKNHGPHSHDASPAPSQGVVSSPVDIAVHKRISSLIGRNHESGKARPAVKPLVAIDPIASTVSDTANDDDMYDVFLNLKPGSGFQYADIRGDFVMFKRSDGHISLQVLVQALGCIGVGLRFWFSPDASQGRQHLGGE